MKDIAIYGAGGFGRELACLLNSINKVEPTWNLVGFFDDNPDLKGQMISHFGVCLGGMDVLNAYLKELALVIPIGNSKVVKTLVGKITNRNVYYPNIIHPDVIFSDPETFRIGKGNILQTGCRFSTNISIGDFNIFNGEIALGHDDSIGDFNTFMPDVRISGAVEIGDENFFGVGSIILQTIKIGRGVRLGAGGVLMSNPSDGKLYVGIPARKTEF